MKARWSTCLRLILAVSWIPGRAESLSQVFKKVKDSVVVIATEQKEPPSMPGGEPVSVPGLGSGVLVEGGVKVLTAAHVVQTASKIRVQLASGEVVGAKVSASEPSADVALLLLDRAPKSGTPAIVGDSDLVEVGDQIIVVGAPLGISHTLTVGHISARRQMNTMHGGLFEAEFFQTDAAINPGNSGGPMFNMAGDVIGVVSHIISRSGGSEGLGFVVTSNMARRLVLEQRSMWSGLEGFVLTDDLAGAFNLPQERGVLVQRIAENSPAQMIGLQPGSLRANIEGESLLIGGDIILEVQGINITTEDAREQIRNTMRRVKPGEEVSVTVWRKGQREKLTWSFARP
jgi:S1-C subfamily serine protease